MSLKPYPDYKVTGIEWLGEIPGHWVAQPAIAICKIITSTVDKKSYDGEVPVRLCNYTDVYYNDVVSDDPEYMKATATPAQIRLFTPKAGDVAITKDSETSDDIGISSYVPHDLPGVVFGYHLAIYRPMDKRYGRFLKYLFDSKYVKVTFENKTPGVTRVGLGQNTLKYLRVPTPPVQEAQAIADYLDWETSEIDAFIADQEELIALLNERRSAFRDYLIEEAEKSAPLKRLKRVADVTVGIVVTPSAWYAPEGVPALRGLNIKEGAIALDNVVHLTEEGHILHKKSMLREDDVVVVRTGQAGTAARVPKEMDGYNAIDLLISRPHQELTGEYLTLVINSQAVRGQISAGSVGAIQGHFNVESLRNLVLRIPTVRTQKSAVARWDEERTLIDAAIADAREAISLSKERRAAVISAAVTGKIDVHERAMTELAVIQGEPVGVA